MLKGFFLVFPHSSPPLLPTLLLNHRHTVPRFHFRMVVNGRGEQGMRDSSSQYNGLTELQSIHGEVQMVGGRGEWSLYNTVIFGGQDLNAQL